MRLILQSSQQVLADEVIVANSLWTRTKGLLGRKEFPNHKALWIKQCQSIHTFFMLFSIDLVFVDANLKVAKVVLDVVPGRLTWPVWNATSVFELGAGNPLLPLIKKGEQLHVGT